MNAQNTDDIVLQAELIYQQKLKANLEASHTGKFVAIEPNSGDFFLGDTLSEALGAARKAHPDRLSHVIRVGHRSAVHLGAGQL